MRRVVGPIVDFILGDTSCVVLASGQVACWGLNRHGVTGKGGPHREARIVPHIRDAVRLGLDSWGQIAVVHRKGRVSTLSKKHQDLVTGMIGIRQFRHGCGLDSAGAVFCSAAKPKDRRVTGLPKVAQLASSLNSGHRCYTLVGGRVRCVRNSRSRAVPASVAALRGIRAVAVGRNHDCALRTNGRVVCWGSGDYGQLGPVKQPKPGVIYAVPGITDGVEILAQHSTTCVLRRSGGVSCWGAPGWRRSHDHRVINLPRIQGAHGLRFAGDAICVLVKNRAVKCLGIPPRHRPLLVPGVAGARQVVVNADQTWVLLKAGRVKCWGRFYKSRTSGGRRVGGTQHVLKPTTLLPGRFRHIDSAKYPSRGADVCGVRVDGKVVCYAGGKVSVIPGIKDAEQVALGQAHGCARTRDGKVFCWGDNGAYQGGRAKKEETSTARRVANLVPVSVLSAGGDSTCAIGAKDQRVYCWGAKHNLGDGSKFARYSPGPVPNLRATSVEVSGYHVCAIARGGRVRCWGPDAALAKPDPPIDDAVSLWVGEPSCALRRSKRMSCWGKHNQGILRALLPPARGKRRTNTYDWPFSSVLSMAQSELASSGHACLVLGSGQVVCLGTDHHGVLGRGGSFAAWTSMVVSGR